MSFLSLAKTTVYNLFTKPATLMYPYKPAKVFKNTRGRITLDYALCIFCSMCAKKCPTDAITVNKNDKIWQIDRIKCISCAACVEVCPKKCLFMSNQNNGVYSSSEKPTSIEVRASA